MDFDLLFLLTGILGAVWLLLILARGWSSGRKTLPGPWGLPVLGSLLLLDPKKPYEALRALVRRYGPLYQLQLGGIRTVVLASEELIRSTFAQEGSEGRAPLYLTFGIMHGRGLICAQGELWREHRRFTIGVMRSLGIRSGKARAALEARILETVQTEIRHMGHPSKATLLDPNASLLHSLGNSMNLLIFGITYDRDDPVWQRLQFLLEEGSKLIAVAGPLNFLPWLRYLPKYRRTIKFIMDNQVKSHEIYQEIIDKFKANEEAIDDPVASPSDAAATKHFVDAYLKEIRERGVGLEGSFTLRQLHYVAADLFGAGTETTLTTLRWLLLDVASDQRVQALAYEELLRATEGHDSVAPGELSSLVYTQATVMETMRKHPVVPLGAPHGTTKDLTIEGYHVPRGTMIIPLLAELHLDTERWDQPEDYRPERFIDSDTGLLRRRGSFLPFQCGRRVCPGEDFGRLLLLTYLTQLLLHYRIMLPQDYVTEYGIPTTAATKTPPGVGGSDHQARSDEPLAEVGEHLGVAAKDESTETTTESDGIDWSSEFSDTGECLNADPFCEPVCGFTTTPRPYKVVFVPRSKVC